MAYPIKTKMYIDGSGGFKPEIDELSTLKMFTSVAAVVGGTGVSVIVNTGMRYAPRYLSFYHADGVNLSFVLYDGAAGAATGTKLWQQVVATATEVGIDLTSAGIGTAAAITFDTVDTAGADLGLTTHVTNIAGNQWTTNVNPDGKPYASAVVDLTGNLTHVPHPLECRVSGVVNANVTAGTGARVITIGAGQKVQLTKAYIFHNEGADIVFYVYDGNPATTGTLLWSRAIPTATGTTIDLSSLPVCDDTNGVYIDVGTTTVDAFLPVISVGGLKWTETYV